MASIELLQERIKSLEQQLAEAKSNNAGLPAREKIQQMSSEVVDTNPYRWQ
jgi:cell division septum initiation protein DivIVA